MEVPLVPVVAASTTVVLMVMVASLSRFHCFVISKLCKFRRHFKAEFQSKISTQSIATFHFPHLFTSPKLDRSPNRIKGFNTKVETIKYVIGYTHTHVILYYVQSMVYVFVYSLCIGALVFPSVYIVPSVSTLILFLPILDISIFSTCPFPCEM